MLVISLFDYNEMIYQSVVPDHILLLANITDSFEVPDGTYPMKKTRFPLHLVDVSMIITYAVTSATFIFIIWRKRN